MAEKINKESNQYEISKLQDLRKDIKGLDRRACPNIFHDKSISTEDDWAIHYGGRKEIQFNIAFEDIQNEGKGLRYGLAFSLETSQSLPDLRILHPKIFKLNILIKDKPELFSDYKMWIWEGDKRGETTNVQEITSKYIKEGTFIFIGKLVDIEDINYDEILSTFDDLLDIYIKVETGNEQQQTTKFEFGNVGRNLSQKSKYTTVEKEINITARHSYLQKQLYNKLVAKHGKDMVKLENIVNNNNRIDIAVKEAENEYIFYEVKTGISAKSCIREAMGQLLEYAFRNKDQNNKIKLVVASEFTMDKTTSAYMELLKSDFNILISYCTIPTKE